MSRIMVAPSRVGGLHPEHIGHGAGGLCAPLPHMSPPDKGSGQPPTTLVK